MTPPDPASVIRHLVDAINRRDLDAFLQAFDPAYRSDQPAHPELSFVGVDRVAENWGANLTRLADLRWELLATSVDGDDVWSELRWTGTRHDGSAWRRQGVIIYTVRDARIVAARLYMQNPDASEG